MRDASVEVQLAGFYLFEDGVLAHDDGACFFGGTRVFRVGRADDADASAGIDGVGEA